MLIIMPTHFALSGKPCDPPHPGGITIISDRINFLSDINIERIRQQLETLLNKRSLPVRSGGRSLPQPQRSIIKLQRSFSCGFGLQKKFIR
jgi:hypothetical protein